MRAFITGATGHIGCALTRLLVRAGHDVTILARSSSRLKRLGSDLSRIKVVPGDLQDISALASAFEATRPNALFHLAWFGVSRPERNDERQIEANVLGSLNLLRVAHRAGIDVFVGLGSQAEYGPPGGVLSEKSPTRPVSLYGAAKLSVGALAQALCDGAWSADARPLRCAWVRLIATYGPFDDENHLIPSLITALGAGRKPQLTSGRQKWDYLFVDDAAEALLRVALVPEAKGVFVLGSGEAHTVQEIAEKIRALVDPNMALGFGEVSEDHHQIMHLEADITRLRSITGWSPSIPLAEGLRRTVDWHRERFNGTR